MDEHGWLRPIQVIDPPSVGDEPNSLELVHKVLQCRVDDVI